MRVAGSAQDLIRSVEAPQLKTKIPHFNPGDTVRLTLKVPEGDKMRQQLFEGVVISRRAGGTREMLTVRKISFGIGVERTIPIQSPFLAKIEVVSRGKSRRAKLYYLRERTGRAAKIRQQFGGIEAPEAAEAAPAAATEAKAADASATEAKAGKKDKKDAKKPEAAASK